MLLRIVALVIFLGATSLALAQEAVTGSLPWQNREAAAAKFQAPESAWLDLRQNAPTHATVQSAPGWVESVAMVAGPASAEGPAKSVFRIRVVKPAGEYPVLFFRLFFDDKPDARPELVAWDESSTQVLRSGALGSGIDVPSSDSVMIPMNDIAAIDIEVPGDGTTVRGAYLDWMTNSQVVRPLSTEHRDVIAQPFSESPPLHAPEKDIEKFGAVTATLSADTIRIGSSLEQGAAFQFGIESQPLFALLTFEVAAAQVDSPPEVYVNGENIGPATLALPELADPGYLGEMESLVRQMRFQYTGWLRGQKLVPASYLKAGTNDILIVSGEGTSASAIRATQIQLKYLWDKTDYLLETVR